MTGRTRILSIATASLLGSYLLAALVLPRVVDADRWRPQAEARLTELLGRPVRLEPLRLSLWTGVTVRSGGLRVGSEEPGHGMRLTAGQVSVRPRILSLLRGEARLRSIRIDDAVLVASSGRTLARDGALSCAVSPAPGGARVMGTVEGSWAGAGGGSAAITSRFDVTAAPGHVTFRSLSGTAGPASFRASGELAGAGGPEPRLDLRGSASLASSLAEGTISVAFEPGRPTVRFEVHSSVLDFDEIARAAGRTSRSASASLLVPVALAADEAGSPGQSALAGVAGSGRITADRGRLAGIELTSLVSDVRIADGDVRFEGASFDVHGGKARGDVVVGTGGPMPFHLTGRVDGVAAGPLVRDVAPSFEGAVAGTTSLELDVTGEAGARPIAPTLRGSARLAVRDGKLETFGMLEQVRAVLEMAGGRGIGKEETPFDHLSASFSLAGGTARTPDLEFRSPDLDLDGGGTVGLAGPLKLQVLASFSREATADFVQRTPQLKIRVGPDGRLTVPLSLRGTLGRPEVKLDLDRVLQDGLKQSVKDLGTKSLLRRLLGKEKN